MSDTMSLSTAPSTQGARFDAYANRADPIMLVLALVFLVFWSITSIGVDLPPQLVSVLHNLNRGIWVVFAVDLIVRIVIAQRRWRFLWTHPADVLAVAVPMLRPLKILTVFTSGSRLVTSRGALRTGQAVIVSAVLLIYIGAVAILNAERGAEGAQIVDFGDALWWALVTVTTVGYGDFAPVTSEGRGIAAALMVIGIALLGIVTASVAAWFVQLTTADKDQREEASIAKNEREIKRLHKKIDTLESKIDALLERKGR